MNWFSSSSQGNIKKKSLIIISSVQVSAVSKIFLIIAVSSIVEAVVATSWFMFHGHNKRSSNFYFEIQTDKIV